MKQFMFAMLAVLSLSLAATALATTASADTYLNPPNQNQGSNS